MKRATSAVWAVAVVGMLGWAALPALGQNRIRNGVAPGGIPRAAVDANGPDGEALLDGVFLPPDRNAKRRLEQAREILQSAKPVYTDSVKVLGTLLESGEDYFFRPDPTQPVYHSLKAEAGRLIAGMPREGQEVYELTFGATARRMLDEAVSAGDMAKVSEVARRFFYTEAGWEATVLVARNHLDHGSPLAAALSYQRLAAIPAAAKRLEPMLSLSLATSWARGGMPEKADEVLAALKKKYPDAQVHRGDGTISAFSKESLAWLLDKNHQRPGGSPELEQWTMFRGDPGRNAASGGGGPLLSARWQQRVFGDPATESRINQLRQSYVDQDIAALPCAHPLAIGNTVLMRRPDGIYAVDFKSGKLLWQYEDVSFKKFQDAARSVPGSMNAVIEQRTWDDATYGTMSSDGERVYYIDNLVPNGVGSPMMGGVRQINFNGRLRMEFDPKHANCLVARELASELMLRWYVGTAARGNKEDGAEPDLADYFFLGPPLPLSGHLYVLAETPGQEIRLVVLSAKDGRLEWSQQLAVVDQETRDAGRRMSGASPSYADGVLVCPTSAGAVVAVDLATRSLLWGYTFQPLQNAVDQFQAMRMGRGLDFGSDQRTNERWADTTATIVDGRVIITPIESDAMFCLDLLDGKLHWKQERGNNLYVACVDDGKVIVVGHKRVSAYKLSDGTPAWSTPIEPPGTMPSGRGYHSGKYYYLPLSTADVAKINLADGRIESRARSRHGEIPGNLICFRGEVVSQGNGLLETFYQLESLQQQVAETLKNDPDRPTALAQLGQIKLDEGKLHEAIGLFRRAHDLDHGDTSRDLLVDSLLEGLHEDFAGSRKAAQELEGLIDRKPQKLKFLRYMAKGLQKSGETLAAFQTYIKLLDQEPVHMELDEADDSLHARRDYWIQGQLNQLSVSAKPEEQRQIDAIVDARLKAALAPVDGKQQITALRAFLHLFAMHPAADEAREQLAARLTGKDTLLEREQLLRRLEASVVEARARRATARLAILFNEANRPEFAAIYYRKMLERWQDQDCLNGKTGRELADQLDAKSPVRKWIDGNRGWPLNLAEKPREVAARRPANVQRQRLVDIDVQGNRGPYFEGVNVSLDTTQRMIVGRDGLGNERFRVSLAQNNQRMAFAFNGLNGANASLNYVSVNGNLLLLSLGYQLLAIDTLRSSSDNLNRVLWSRDLVEGAAGVQMSRIAAHLRPLGVAWGPPKLVSNDGAGRPVGTIGPVNAGGVCFQRLRELYSVNPLTGETIWMRKNIPAGCDLFGDEEFLFVVPPDGSPALVLSAINGELLGQRFIPPLDQRMATVGRFMLVWTSDDRTQSISLQDPWQEGAKQVVWTRKVARDSKACVIPQEAVGVLEPGGAFVLLNLLDGKPIVEEALEKESTLTSIYMLRSDSQYLLVTNSPAEKPQTFAPVSSSPNDPAISGRVYAFSRATGKKMWARPAFIDQYGLVLTQPCELPVLTFMRHATVIAGETKASVLCIDKRSGATLYHNDDLGIAINTFEFVGDREKATVSIHLPGKTIVLPFTHGPRPGTWLEGFLRAVHGTPQGESVAPEPDGPAGRASDSGSENGSTARGEEGPKKGRKAKKAADKAKPKADAKPRRPQSADDPFGDADDPDSPSDDSSGEDSSGN